MIKRYDVVQKFKQCGGDREFKGCELNVNASGSLVAYDDHEAEVVRIKDSVISDLINSDEFITSLRSFLSHEDTQRMTSQGVAIAVKKWITEYTQTSKEMNK